MPSPLMPILLIVINITSFTFKTMLFLLSYSFIILPFIESYNPYTKKPPAGSSFGIIDLQEIIQVCNRIPFYPDAVDDFAQSPSIVFRNRVEKNDCPVVEVIHHASIGIIFPLLFVGEPILVSKRPKKCFVSEFLDPEQALLVELAEGGRKSLGRGLNASPS